MKSCIYLSGGLGNQMFQYAFAMYLKQHFPDRNVVCYIDLLKKDNGHNGFELASVFGDIRVNTNWYMCQFTRLLYQLVFIRKYNWVKRILSNIGWDFIMEEDLLHSLCSSHNHIFLGYWQSYKFAQIENVFRFHVDRLSNLTINTAREIDFDSNSVSIHIRRGDYMNCSTLYGGICTLDYYQNAIQYIKTHVAAPSFFVFSDDLEWVKNNIRIPNAHYIDFNRGHDSWQDMYLMSCCKHNIIANSTFSWWGACLNKNNNKIVIRPPRMTNDPSVAPNIFPKEWIAVDNQ